MNLFTAGFLLTLIVFVCIPLLILFIMFMFSGVPQFFVGLVVIFVGLVAIGSAA
jgi:hypothetical protein